MAGLIICGVDETESAKGAARVARALAGELGLELVFVRVVDENAFEAKVTAISKRLERLSDDSREVDCGAVWLVETGHPADRLVAVAKRADAAMIVVGSTGPRSSLLGSVSADVSRGAPCPVVVVPPGGDARLNGDGNGRVTGHSDEYEITAEDRGFAGGIARIGLADGHTTFAGGIARYGLGAGEPRG